MTLPKPPRDSIGSFRDKKWKEQLVRSSEDTSALSQAPFVTLAPSGSLSNERVLSSSSEISVTDNGSGSSAQLGLATTGVSPGTYSLATITVDSKGRVTSAATGTVETGAAIGLGMIAILVGATVPDGWLLMNGTSIGSVSSGATGRANADVADLYSYLWTSLPDYQCPVSGGRGVSAAADFAANKTLTLPDVTQRLETAASPFLSVSFVICFDPGAAGTGGGASTATLGRLFMLMGA